VAKLILIVIGKDILFEDFGGAALSERYRCVARKGQGYLAHPTTKTNST
jgi:hypothetical protein